MSEIQQILITFMGYIVVILFGFLYALGGRKDIVWYQRKWVRRYAGGILLPLGLIMIAQLVGSFRITMIGAIPGYIIALSFGYGAEKYLESIGRRFIYGLVLGLQAAWFMPYEPSLLLFSVCLAVIASLYLGIKNPVDSPSEEFGIAVLSTAVLPLII